MADSSWNSVVLLLPCDGADASNTFTDYSPKKKTVTAQGGAQIDTAQSKFGGSSGLFEASVGYYLSLSDSDDWDFGTGDFTVEAWIRPYTTTDYRTIFGGGANELWFGQSSAGLMIAKWYDSTICEATTGLTANTWHHVAFVRSGTTTWKIYINGTQVGSTGSSSESFSYASAPRVASATNTASYRFNGHIDDLRITKGVARYTGDFTAPSEAFPLGPEGLSQPALTVLGNSPTANYGSGAAEASGSTSVSGVSAATAASLAVATPTAAVSGIGVSAVILSTPIAFSRIISVSVGLPIRFNLEAAVSTVSIPVQLGNLLVSTVTLPIHINVATAVSTVTLPIRIYGDISTYAAADFVQWRVGIILNGIDISDKLIGAGSVEFEEMASPIAQFSFLPAAGAVDPLGYVNQPCVITWQRVVGGSVANTALLFTGVVSDPSWDADERVMSIRATADMQTRYDLRSKTQIMADMAAFSPSYSEYVFGPEADLSGWEYAQALISTTSAALWVDAIGLPRITSIEADGTADYTFGDDDIIAGTLGDSPQYASRQEMVNRITIEFQYRWQRRRERRIRCTFRDIANLDTPAIYLSGNLGGWDLPQRTQVESAANGGGWTVIGDISYSAVWPSGTYPTYSDSGGAMWEGWSNIPSVTDELCIGATWTAARRWLQTVTETATLVVNATESQEIIGLLADNESYSIEDEATDEEWESSLEYTDYVSGATLMSNGVDKRADLDELRSAFEQAQLVALAKAKNDLIRAHRGTTVTFGLPLSPSLDLSHTVDIDTTYLECHGKVRRITHAWDIETGDATTTADIAISRNNGAGLVVDTPLAATAKAADPTEAAPATTMTMAMYIGGQDDRPLWSTVENESGYFVNLPFDPSYGTNTLLGSWSRNPANSAVAPRIYDEGFAVKYPDIAATYANPSTATTTAAFEVAIPEDSLTITSG